MVGVPVLTISVQFRHCRQIILVFQNTFSLGLKPGQRKVLYTCMKRNDKHEVKVAQLAGSIAELSAYHHGEVMLLQI